MIKVVFLVFFYCVHVLLVMRLSTYGNQPQPKTTKKEQNLIFNNNNNIIIIIIKLYNENK